MPPKSYVTYRKVEIWSVMSDIYVYWKKKWQMVVFLCGSSLQSRQQFLNRVIYRADISAAFSVYFTKCTFLQLICWAGKGHHHQTFAKCKLGSPFSALPSNVELSFLKKVVLWFRNEDVLYSVLHTKSWFSIMCPPRYTFFFKSDLFGCHYYVYIDM